MSQDVESAVRKLMDAEEGQLLEQIGIRSQAIQKDASAAGAYDPGVVHDAAAMGALDDLRAFGGRLFKRLNVQAWGLVCGTDSGDTADRDKLLGALKIDPSQLATVLAPMLVSQIGLAPAIASVVAVLIAKRFFNPVYQEFCSTWKENLPTLPS